VAARFSRAVWITAIRRGATEHLFHTTDRLVVPKKVSGFSEVLSPLRRQARGDTFSNVIGDMNPASAAVRRSEIAVVRGAAVAQGLALVTIPTLSSVLTDPKIFALSQTAYGALFIPQSILAIVFSLAGGRLTQRFGIKRVLFIGLATDALSMGLLASTVLLTKNYAASYSLLLCATGCLGFGFAVVTPALNVLSGDFDPQAVDRAVLIVNALLGAAAALAPMLLAAFVGLGIWWGLPLLACVAMLVLFVESTRLPFDVASPDASGPDASAPGRRPASPSGSSFSRHSRSSTDGASR
jgi:MFS family permease